jgi:hypothetical protein
MTQFCAGDAGTGDHLCTETNERGRN